MKRITWIALGIFTMVTSSAQSLRIGFLFNPGVTFGSEYTFPAAISDTTSFSIRKLRSQFTIPLKTKLEAKLDLEEIKKLNFRSVDLRARQDFIMVNFSQRDPRFSLNSSNQKIYTGAVGYTGISAGLRKGIWIYSANFYLSESTRSFKDNINPNFLLYTAKVRLNNLKFIYFYGAALIYNQRKWVPAPIFGFTQKLNNQMRLTAILPVQISLTYKVSKSLVIDLMTTLSGFNSVYRDPTDSNVAWMNYRHVKTNLAFTKKLSKGFKISLESGYSLFRALDIYDLEQSGKSFRVKAAPYMSLNINYNLGRGLLESKLEGVD